MSLRQLNLTLHRYFGLLTAVFLLLTGLSGTLLVYNKPIDDYLNRHLVTVTPPMNVPPRRIEQLHDQVLASFPKQRFSSLPLSIEPNRSVVFTVDRQRGQALPFHDVYINPYTAEIIGTRNRDAWHWQNAMTKTFWFHRNLLLGEVGQWVLGVTALLWTFNCFIGFYLTFPRHSGKKPTAKRVNSHSANRPRPPMMTWLKKWRHAWKIRRFSNWFKWHFDLHHALGLWFWGLALAIAWSSVGFNLKSVYQPVMQALGMRAMTVAKPTTDPRSPLPMDKLPTVSLAISKPQALVQLPQMAAQVASTQGLHYETALGLRWIADERAWQLRFKTDEDIGHGRGASSLTINAQTGAVNRVNFGSRAPLTNRMEQWWHSLHLGHFDSKLYQVLLALFGVVTAVMSVSGVYLWWHGYQARKRIGSKLAKRSTKRTH